MNHVFRVVWSASAGTFVAVSEYAKSHGKGRNGGRRGGKLRKVGLVLSAGMVFSPMLQAVDRYWDTNGTALGSGGSGAWNLTSAFWSPNGDGASGPYSSWNNAALYDAIFAGTAGTVTLGTPITVHNLTFQTTGYTLTGSTLTLGGITPTINTSGTVTINSILAGSAGLTKTGAGLLSLNGVNTFSGDVLVNAGGLALNGDSALGVAGNGVTMASGTNLSSTAALAASRNITVTGGTLLLAGAGVGSARFTGAGGLRLNNGVSLTNAASNYTGATIFGNGNGGSFSFNSIADLGVASSLGAPTTVANGTITLGSGGGVGATLSYFGAGSSSNRNWQLSAAGTVAPLTFRNIGTGTLTLTGNMVVSGGSNFGTSFSANNADMSLLGIISGNGSVSYTGGAGRTITLGNVNTYTTATGINGVTVRAGSLKDTGTASSFGTGTGGGIGITNGALSYTGAGDNSNRTWGLNGGAINNDGTGALALSGTLALTNTGTLGGSYTGADNLFSGVISGTGGVAKSGASTWVLSGANTYTGSTTVNGGTLRAGSNTAFGSTNGVVVNSGGTLDLNDLDNTVRSLAGTGGTVDLGSGELTLNAAAGVSTAYAGNITGSGGLTKTGASTQTLTGTNTYTGATTVSGGTLRLDFGAATAPTSNIISSASTLNLGGGVLNAIGAASEANTQTFNGVLVTAGNNTIGATSGTGGSMTVNLGGINRTGGLVNFNLPGSGNITTTNTTLGGWATVNGTDYAKVVGGNILAFTNSDYIDKDNAATWLSGDFISDSDANTESFFGTVAGSKQLGGLQFTTADPTTTITVANGQTLGVDGTILVAPSVGANNQTITGGSLTGTSGGGVLGIQQNGTGNFTIASQIVNNGGAIGFTKAGTGLVTLTNTNNTYTGATTVSQGILSVGNIGNGGTGSGIGASSAASSNLFLEGSTLRYTGLNTTSDRGFTIAKSGAILGSIIDVTGTTSNLTFNGQVTSTDGATFTKTGAGTLTLGNAGNDYTGITTVTGGTLAVNTLADGDLVSGIGASSNASGNLVLNGGTLGYLGGTTSTDRGFTLGTPGAGGSVGAIGVSNAATTLTISGTAVGDDGFRKDGPGTLVLSGTNTYSGGTTVAAGTLRAGSTQAFGTTNNGLTVASGATADLNGFNISVGALQGLGNVALGSGTLTSVLGGTFGGVISGSGGYRQGGGTQTMSGCNNTYTGVTAMNNGGISVDCLANGGQASGIGASTSAASNVLFNSGTLNYTGGNVNIDRGLTMQSGFGVLTVSDAATTLGISGAVGGAGTLYKRGPGTLVLSGNNTYTGGTVVDQAGILRAGSATAFGNGSLNMGNVAGATLDANGFNQSFTWLQGGGTTGGNINLGGQTLTISQGNNTAGVAYAGNIIGAGNLVKSGAQVQRMSGCNNSYTGTTTINGGTLAVDCLADGGSNSGAGASSAAASNLIINGATLSYTGANQSSDRLFTLGTGGGSLDASGTGALNLTNAGAIALSGTNAARTLTLNGTNTGNNTLSAQLDNNGTGLSSLTKTGAGTWILTNNNSSYTGVTTVTGGVLGVSQLSNGGTASGIGAASSAAANLVIGNGSTLRYTGAGDSSDRLFTLAGGVSFLESSGTGAINLTNPGTIGLSNPNVARTVALGGTNTGNNTVAGVIGNSGTGITTLAKNGGGTWVLTGNNTYTGDTVINDGNLMIGDGNTSGNLGTGNVIVDAATSTLSMNRSDTVIFNAIMSGPGTFAQVGGGTTTLTANNSIGATTVSAGTLDVNGVLNTGTIGMSGTSILNVDGTVQAAGGTTAAITGDTGTSTINVSSGATLRANGDLGDGSDALTVTGTLDTGAAVLNLGAGNDTLTINDGVINGVGIDAGAGTTDSLVINNALAKTFGGFSGFEQLTKNNAGMLTLTGNQNYSIGTAINGGTLDVNGTLETPALSMADATTLNVDGTVQGTGATTATLTGSAGANTLNISSGATLQANGSLGDGIDNVTLAGTLNTGSAALDLGAGDETLILRDGTVISGVGINAGTGNDQLVLDNALALTFSGGATAGFESLLKQNSGVTTMTGSQSFSAGTTLNGGVLNVVGAMETPTVALADGTTLNVNGSLQGAGATAATITGSAGVNTLTVGAGANLIASGDLGDGNDVLDVAGTLDTGGGTFALGNGDDTLSIHGGTSLIGTVTAGAGTDTFATDIATSADVGAVQGFETLTKTGVGSLSFTGPAASDFTTVNVLAGNLNINAAAGFTGVTSATVASNTTLNVDGSLGFTAGADSFTVGGNVTGAGTIAMLDGDDQLLLQNGADLSGLTTAIDGGLGNDTLTANIATTAALGGAINFETLIKSNVGTLNINGPVTSQFGTVLVQGGTLHIAAGTIVDPQTTVVSSGATMTVDGTYQGTTGDDTFTVSGTVDGAGTINLLGGDDVLTLNDGADLNGLANPLDGGAHGTGDTVVLNNAGAFALDGSDIVNFERLQKNNIGTLALNGTHSFSGGTAINGGTLDVNGALTTSTVTLADNTTLNVDGSLQGTGGTAATVTGSVGINTVTVGSGATLLAIGDLGAGNDVLDVTGTLDTDGGTFALGDGDDTLSIHDGTSLIGTVTAGAGTDTFATDIATSANVSAVQGFETLTKTGVGALSFTGPAASDFTTVNVQAGNLNINAAAGFTGVTNATVASAATLNVDGSLGFTTGADSFTVAGTVAGAGTIDMLDGDDQLLLQEGADLSGLTTAIDGGLGNDTLTANIATAAALGGAINFETLIKSNIGTLNVDGPASSFTTVNVSGGVLDIGAAGAINGVVTTTVASGATLNVDGGYTGSTGDDTFTVSGTVNGAGTIDLLDGDDVLTLNDGADLSGLANPLDGGVHGAGDAVVLNNTGAFALNGSDIVNFELLQKNNTGTAALNGTQSFSGGTAINGGTLDVNGALTTPTVTLADNTTLLVDGSLQGTGGTAATITGSTGINTVTINGTVAATGDLGAGNDVLEMFGTLDTQAGTFALGDGDDSFIVHDGTVTGTVDGGLGLDTRVYDIDLTADLGALVSFEGVTKTGAGTLNINGPVATDLQQVSVLDGTLNIGALGSVVGTPGSTLTTLVGSGGTLNVDGSYGCSDGDDSMTVSGTVSGSGTVDLCGGDDTLTLNDGAVLNTNVVSGGNDGTSGDTVVLNNALAATFDLSNTTEFETLRKDNTGTATLIGLQDFGSVNVMAGTLDVDGTLEASNISLAGGTTFNVDGVAQGSNGTEVFVGGDDDVNTVTIGAGGLLFATGDLAGSNDVLDVFGELNTNGSSLSGVLSLGDGADLFTLHDGAVVDGVVYGADGTDTAIADINLTADLGALVQFEVLTKTGVGTLNINGDTDGVIFPSSIQNVDVQEGTLNIGPDGTVEGPADGSPLSTLVASGATLNVDGSYGCGTGNDTMTVGGTVTGSGTIDLCAGDDTLTLNDGADLSGLVNSLDGGDGTADTVLADITGTAVLGGVVNFETLIKSNIGTLNVDGPASSSFTTVNVNGGTLDIGASGAINGVVTTTVASGATLNVDGGYTGSAGDDTFTVSGTVNGAGTIDLLDGDDVLTLNDGADLSGLANPLDGGAHGAGDTVVLNNASAFILDGSDIVNFELLQKNNTGTAALNGIQTFSGGTAINGGTLDVNGTLTTPTVTLADNTTLTVDGSLQGTGGTAATITGSTGINTVTVGTGATLLASGDLGTGNDVLDVAGTLDTLGGAFELGDGDDSFVVHDGTVALGTIDGGAGLDTRVYDINLTADLGELLNFEGVTKTGTGVLNIVGPGATDLQEVSVLGGTLNIGATASVVATAGNTLATVVGSGGTLNVDGSFGCGAGNDTMSVSGTVSGSGSVDLCGGDDTLTLNDGAVLNNAIDGGANGAGDTVVLNNAAAMTLDGANTTNFEFLTKNNVGVATLIGTSAFLGGTSLNAGTLDVDGTLNTPTFALGDDTVLNVDGSLQAVGGTAATLTGSAGINTVSIGAGGTLLASGDLGAGNDVLDITGTLDTAGGVFGLGDGDDTLTIHDGTSILGTVAAGAGNDTFNADIAASANLGAVQDFETLSKTNVGVLNINGPASSAFTTVNVLGGILNVGAGGSVSAQTTTVAAGATLDVQGSYTGTAGDDVLDVAGTLDTGAGSLLLGDGNDTFTLHDGTVVQGTVDGGAGTDTFNTNIATVADLGAVSGFEALDKTGVGTLNLHGPAISDFSLVTVSDGMLNVAAGGSIVAASGGVLGTVIASGATLNVEGSYGCGAGNDTMNVSGTVSGSGSIDLCGGDDTLTLNDGALLANVIDGGANGAGDTVVLNNAAAMTFDGGNTTNFEFLTKDNLGVATLVGTSTFLGGTALNAGTLDVDGTLNTPTVTLGDDSTLNVDGSLQAAGGTAATLTGSAGINTVSVGAGGTLLASGDLGAGNDVLDVVGTLNTGAGNLLLGDGDDSFVVHDGTVVLGVIDGGAGLDTRVYDIALTADLGELLNFEGVTKTGTGVLNIVGPGATDLQEVSVLGGTLNVGANAGVVASAGNTLATVVGSGGTLNVEGSYGCGAGNDTMSVAGTVSGSGTIDLCGGDDTLTLNDGAVLNNVIDGGANGAGDTVVLNNAAAMTLDGANTTNFEFLTKDNVGVATLAGTSTFLGGTALNAGTLDVDGTLNTPTVTLGDNTVLNVDGRLQAVGGTAATLTGSAGINTVSIGAGGTLLASGDLGAGNDVLDVAGTLDTAGGIFALGDGDDTLTIHDGTSILGTVAAGAGNDTFNADIAASANLGAVQGFETLSKTNVGVLNINGPASSDFTTVNVLGGTLNINAAASVTGVSSATVASNSALNVNGSLGFTTGADSFTVGGNVAGAGTIDMLDGDDQLTLQDGADLSGLTTAIDGGLGTDTLTADFTGSAILGGAVNFETLIKSNVGTLNINSPVTSQFDTVLVQGGTLHIAAGTVVDPQSTVVSSGATMTVDGTYQGTTGDDTFTVSGTVNGTGTINLLGGDDVLTLNDGANLSGLANPLDGGAHGTGDTVVLNNAGAFALNGGNIVNFEFLRKYNTGTATLTGTQSFIGGATINGGTLDVDGAMTTPTVTLGDNSTLNVDGRLQALGGTAATLTGSAGTNTVSVGAGGTLLASGDLGAGNDVLDVAGTLNTGAGSLLLGDGNDTFTIHDGTVVLGTVGGGAGTDTFNTNIATVADLGAVSGFEVLDKTGVGTLNVNGPAASDFSQVTVNAGTLNVGTNGSVMAQTTTVAAGATLNVQGRYTGTGGDDSFTSRGIVRGMLDFGAGNDSVSLIGGDVSGLSRLDGGDGNDHLSFSGLDLTTGAPGLDNWEQLDLLDGSALALANPLNLNGGQLSIDSTSRLLASSGSSVGGSVHNDGLINVGSHRLAIGGDYAGNGSLDVQVAASAGVSGGLDISGDVQGMTRVNFVNDGTEATPGTTIRVISSPNDNPSTAGGFVPDNTVRLNGSVLAWNFAKGESDPNWYLSSAENLLLPEIPGYTAVPDIGYAMTLDNNRLLFDRMSGVRGDNPYCNRSEEERTRMGMEWFGKCEGLWLAATGSHLEMDSNPGVEFDGNSTGLYGGYDHLFVDEYAYRLRGGVFIGQQRGNYSTTGQGSPGLMSVGRSSVDMDAVAFGAYGSMDWQGGSYADVSLSALLPDAQVRASDGFKEQLHGDILSLSGQVGHRYPLSAGWMLEPQLQASAIHMRWDDKTDSSGKQLNIKDDVLGSVRAAVRVEKTIKTDGGATLRPWLAVGLQDTLGENSTNLVVTLPGADGAQQSFSGHDLGLNATLDVGLEAQVAKDLRVFGTASVIGANLGGSDVSQQQVSIGVRWTW